MNNEVEPINYRLEVKLNKYSAHLIINIRVRYIFKLG
ncbi:hypothetical protein BDD30_4055 [Photorhabdus asymbiotica]|uniref:Transposase n=1 Tax=Photorhabdus asymbiotica TaxID=291112 RepID=A0ABX9SGL0_9GAMM|nr:hypothetical protein BDD30_4055 [Photorhabdus asymbiotica]